LTNFAAVCRWESDVIPFALFLSGAVQAWRITVRKFLYRVLTLALIGGFWASAAAAQAPPAAALTVGTAESMWSQTLKEERPYLVYTPRSYDAPGTVPQKYPVLYLLDGNSHFHSVTGLLQILGSGINGTYVVPEMIVVAIPNTDRSRDLTPTHAERGPDGEVSAAMKTSGGGPAFLQFVRDELIPQIERRYRAANYRMLVGHSLGGITAINALYTMPDVFNAYIVIDPSLWFDDQRLLKQTKEFFSKPGLAKKTLFVGQANTIQPNASTPNLHFSSIVQFNSILESYNQSGIRYAYKYYPSDNHGSVPLIAEYDALRFIFASYQADIAKALEGPAYLTTHFANVSATLGYDVRPPESIVNGFGNSVLLLDPAKSIEFFRMNTELYPGSSRAFAALGDGLLAKGDIKQAIANFEKSLVLNPKNQHAADMIKKLQAATP
jgi:predicted alpha/beta superfamily hydrolase